MSHTLDGQHLTTALLPKPPSFYKPEVGDTFVKEIRKLVKDQPDAVLDRLEAASHTEETRQFFDLEVGRLSSTVVDIRENFEGIRDQLEDFDEHDLHSLQEDGKTGGNLIPKLAPKWDEFYEDFEQLLEHSLTASSEGMKMADEYLNRILGKSLDPDITDRQLLTEIYDYLKDITSAEEHAANIVDDYDKLRVDIRSFKTDMQLVIGDGIASVSEELKEIDALLEAARKGFEDQVKDATTGFKSWFRGWTVKRTWGDTAAYDPPASADVLAIIAPEALTGILNTSARHILTGGNLDWNSAFNSASMKFDMESVERHHQELVNEDYSLYTLQLEFKRREKDIENIAGKMAVLTRIWKIFNKDARDFRDVIEGIPNVRTNPGMKRHIRMLAATYRLIKKSLESYNVGLSEVVHQ